VLVDAIPSIVPNIDSECEIGTRFHGAAPPPYRGRRCAGCYHWREQKGNGPELTMVCLVIRSARNKPENGDPSIVEAIELTTDAATWSAPPGPYRNSKRPSLGAQISSPFLLGIYVHYFDGVAVKIRNTIRGNREHLERVGSGISHRCLIGKHRHSHSLFVTL
jgi:hypothetical protein